MAVADLIGAAVGVLLLVIVAYILVGSTLSVAETVTSAQKAAALQEQIQMRTDLSIVNATVENGSDINCTIKNTGSEIIADFKHMDVIVYDNSTQDYQLYPYNSNYGISGTWTITYRGNDVIHPSELDPGEEYRIEVFTPDVSLPYWFQITTANGIYASKFL